MSSSNEDSRLKVSNLSSLLRAEDGTPNVSRTGPGFPRRMRLPGTRTEWCILGASLFFTVFSNHSFWSVWAAGRDWAQAKTWMLAVVVAVVLTAVHCILLGLVVTRRTAKPVLALLFIATAMAAHYMSRYTVFFDASMVRNVFHTDVKEARELLSAGMLVTLLAYGIIPALIVSRLRLTRRSMREALLGRGLFLLGALAAGAFGVMLSFQDLSSLMRNQKELRYLITPANFLVSSVRVAAAERSDALTARIPLGTDATHSIAATGKPRLLVVVVGETARAANWGLNGYSRQTTPHLAADGVINFPDVTSCGSNTEVSVPCMFSPYGRKDYDEKAIRRHESVLHVLEHAGVKTIWRDNQSGCKGVCDGLESQHPADWHNAAFCSGDHCFDEVLLDQFESELKKNPRDLVIVLHQLGNHGPAYSRRYPDAFRRFTPTCEEADLGKCSRDQIVNSYDNALLYTDYFLDKAIQHLRTQQSHDAALIYVSDHGESLGEKGIYLHGLPYAIAPSEQTSVPMIMWLSPGFAASGGIDVDCLKSRASHPASHDYLFHSILGMMRVQTSVYQRTFDLAAGCRA